MSEHEVPLEELTEHMHHSAHEAKERWISAVALSTAILATMAAVSALLSSHYEAQEMKTHTEEFDRWAQYQAKSIKASLLKSKGEILRAMDKKPDEGDAKKLAGYDADQQEISHEAKELHETSEKFGGAQERFALSVTMFQVSIAIGAIAVLTRRKRFWLVSMIFGAAGAVFLVIGLMALPAAAKEVKEEKESAAKEVKTTEKKEVGAEHEKKE